MEHPVGIGFRMQVVETSIRDHYNELAAQRMRINQLKELVTTLMDDKETNAAKLDACFGHVDVKLTEANVNIDPFYESAKLKFNSLTEIMDSLAQTTQRRLDALTAVVDQLRSEEMSRDHARATVVHTAGPSSPPMAAPASWVGPMNVPAAPPTQSPGFGIGGGATNVGIGATAEPLISAHQPIAEHPNTHVEFRSPVRHVSGHQNSFFDRSEERRGG